MKLQAAIRYAEEDLPNAKVNLCPISLTVVGLLRVHSLQTLVEQCASDDPDTDFNMGCVLFKVCTVWKFGWPHVQGIHSSPSHYSIVCRIISSQDLVTELCCPSKVVHVLYGGYVLMSPGRPQHPQISVVPLCNGATVVWPIAWQFSQLRQWSQKVK